jgi:hypothetical protein
MLAEHAQPVVIAVEGQRLVEMLQGDGQPVRAVRPGDAVDIRPVQRRLDRGSDRACR